MVKTKSPSGVTDNNEITLWSVARLLLGKFYWLLISGFACALIVWLITTFLIAPTYESRVSFYVYNNADKAAHASTVNNSDLQAAESLATTYSKILESKRQTLLMFADLLEPKRDELETVDKKFASDLFYTFNNFNIRHNNVDPAGPKCKKPVGDLTKEQLESWYDEVYQMCLLAFMRLEHVPRKQEFDMLKDKIENKK